MLKKLQAFLAHCKHQKTHPGLWLGAIVLVKYILLLPWAFVQLEKVGVNVHLNPHGLVQYLLIILIAISAFIYTSYRWPISPIMTHKAQGSIMTWSVTSLILCLMLVRYFQLGSNPYLYLSSGTPALFWLLTLFTWMLFARPIIGNQLLFYSLTLLEFILLIYSGQRLWVVLFMLNLFYIHSYKLNVNKFMIKNLLFVMLVVLPLVLVIRTVQNYEYKSELSLIEKIQIEVANYPSLLTNQFSRMAAESGSLLIISHSYVQLRSQNDYTSWVDEWKWAFIPRFFIQDKPLLKPGLKTTALLYPSLPEQTSYPIGIFAEGILFLGYLGMLTLISLIAILLAGLTRVLNALKSFKVVFPIMSYLALTVFNEDHLIFYISSFIRLLFPLSLAIALLLIINKIESSMSERSSN